MKNIEWRLLFSVLVLALRSKITPVYLWTKYPVFLMIMLAIVGAMPKLMLSLVIYLRLIHILYTFFRLEYEYEDRDFWEKKHEIGFVQIYSFPLIIMVMMCDFLFLEMLWYLLFLVTIDLVHYSKFWREKQTFWYQEIATMRTVFLYGLLFSYAFVHIFSGMWIVLWYLLFLGIILLTLAQMILYIFRPPPV
jgi:hypothetical protein